MSSRRAGFRVGVESLEGRALQAAFGLPCMLDSTDQSVQREVLRLQAQVQRWESALTQQSQIVQGLGAKIGTTAGGVQ